MKEWEAAEARAQSRVHPSLQGSRTTRLARRALRATRLEGLVDLWWLGAARAEGWPLSYRMRRPVDADGAPIPWYTYPCRDFLEPRLKDTFRVFEYGSGNSTLWYAERVAEVISVEHEEAWATEVSKRAPRNATILTRPVGPGYVAAPIDVAPFDIIVVDGMLRPECAVSGIGALASDGVLVWDNSDWDEFRETMPALAERGFRELDFTGWGPTNRDKWKTSILYRSENCLGI